MSRRNTDKRRESEEIDLPSVPRVPRPVRTTIQLPFPPTFRCFLPSSFHNLILSHPPCLLHLPFHFYLTCLIVQEQLGILQQRLGARSVSRRAIQLSPKLFIGDMRVRRHVLGEW